jgi:DNA-binding CsgD family transcriptional regulator
MIKESVLLRASERITYYIDKYVNAAGAERKEEVLEMFDKMHQLFPHWVIMTCPMMHPDIKYSSKNASFLFGYSGEYMIRNAGIDKLFSHVHDADQQDLYDCFSVIHDQYESIMPEDHHKYRAIFHYRFKKPNGQYMYLYDEKATLQLRGSDNLYYVLFRDVTAERPFTGVKVELFKQEDHGLTKIREYKPAARRNALSKREQELVNLMRQGLSTKEIAWYLNISQNTVRNIKSKMFEKYNVNNSIELLNMTN